MSTAKLRRPGPVGGKRHENRLQRSQTLRAAALRLFLDRGIEGVAIDDIVAEAKVAKGSFYRYFADKLALVETLIAPVRVKIETALKGCENALAVAKNETDLLGAYLQMATELSGVLFEDRDIVMLYVRESRSANVGARRPVCDLAESLAEWAYRLTRAAESHGLLRKVNARVTGVAVLGAIERLLYETLRGAPPAEPLAMAEALIAMVLEGLRPPSASAALANRDGAPSTRGADPGSRKNARRRARTTASR